MWETIRAIHEALGIESTWAFVLIVACVFAFLSGSAAWIVDKGYKNSSVYKTAHSPQAQSDPEIMSRIRELIADGHRIVQTCHTVPDPYHTPASNRADLANQIVQFESRAETILSLDADPRPQKMWRNAILRGAPQNPPSIALYCTQLNVKMDILQRILARKLATRQQLRGHLERFIREGAALQASCRSGAELASKSFDSQLNWTNKVMEWLGDNFDENYQDQFNTATPKNQEFGEYPDPIKGPCQRLQPRIEVLESIHTELGS